MRRPVPIRSGRPPKADKPGSGGLQRDRIAIWLAIVTAICLGSAFVLGKGTQFLMPGPLASAHGAIENCSSCHTKSGSGKLSWIHGLVAGDPLADSKACISCHQMPNTALNPHGVAAQVLKRSTDRLARTAAATPAPASARVQSIAFPTDGIVAGGLACATCHQEHKGVDFDLSKASNEQCSSCHVVKFDSFDGNHPKFDDYPFKRRTRIIYDHAGHFGKHFIDVAKKDPDKRIPETCSTCHNSNQDKRFMAVASFDATCSTCHLDQIVGNERVSGPKGVAFLTLPSLDLQTLREKNADVGEWPDISEAELTPFMKVMISRSQRGRTLIETLEGVNLQDLTSASDDQINAASGLAWEIKALFYALISGKASDVLADLNIASGAKLSADLVADLTASIPRDVVISAHQEWLPNLGTEMANRPEISAEEQGGWATSITESRLSGTVSPRQLASAEAASFGNTIRLAQANQQVQPKNTPGTVAEKRSLQVDAAGRVARQAPGAPQAVNPDDVQPVAATQRSAPADAAPDAPVQTLAQNDPPRARAADQTDDLLYPDGGAPAPSGGGAPAPVEAAPAPAPAPAAAQPEAAPRRPAAANVQPGGGGAAISAAPRPQNRAADQTDDLLFPDGGAPDAPSGGEAPPSDVGAVPSADPAPDTGWAPAETPVDADSVPADSPAAPSPPAAPVITIQSDVDPESWAEYGGWYRQDYAIFYRPKGHKDKFIYSWLFLTGPQAPKGAKSPAAGVFDYLTAKDAQGSCTKCHSVDDIRSRGRLVNFTPPKAEAKQGRFTNFVHEPHFAVMENRGCLTCHNVEKGRPYLASYEQGDPLKNFVSNFGAVKKDLCQSCHTTNMASQDCLTCHKYHVNGVVTPIMTTKIPTE